MTTPSRLTSISTPVSTGRASSREAPRAAWLTASRERSCLGRDLGSGGLLEAREILGGQQPERPFVCRTTDMSLRLIGLDIDRGLGERLDRVAQQPGRHERRARFGDLHLGREACRHLEVGRGQRETSVVAGLDQHAGERRDAGTRGNPALDGLERLGQCVAIASELHVCPPPAVTDRKEKEQR